MGRERFNRRKYIFRTPCRHVSRNPDHRDTGSGNGRLHGRLQHPGHLTRCRRHLIIITAIIKQLYRVGLLEIPGPELPRCHCRGNRQHRSPRTMSIIQTVNQMHVSRSATSRTTGQLPVQLRFSPGSISSDLLVTHVYPLDFIVLPHGIVYLVQTIASHGIDTFHAGLHQHVHQLFCNFFCHRSCSFKYCF